MNPKIGKRHRARHGSIAVVAALMMVVVLGMVAFAVDMGYLALARTESQRTADATAHAAVIEFARTGDLPVSAQLAHQTSSELATHNLVLGEVAEFQSGVDVQIGRYDFGSGQSTLTFGDPRTYNAVRVRVRRTDDQNGAVPLFFGAVLSKSHQELEADAITAIVRNVKGFKIPPSGRNVPLLPIVFRQSAWHDAIKPNDDDDSGSDEWSYDRESETVIAGSDGFPEVTLYPNSSGSSGNVGTVNIGGSSNSTSYLGKQIRGGLDQKALDYHGGTLELGDNHKLSLSGDPGLSSGLKDDLKAIIGQIRIIPLYSQISNSGSNADYTIVEFVAGRIMSAELSGNNKGIVIQPAVLVFEGVIQGTSSGISDGIFSSPRIVY